MINQNEIYLKISQLLFEIIESETPYEWVYTEEPFANMYTGRTSYDYSGEVYLMDLTQFKAIVSQLGVEEHSFIYESKLDELLNKLYINQWTATYESNYGKHWIDFGDLLRERYDHWKYNHFELYDEDGNEVNNPPLT